MGNVSRMRLHGLGKGGLSGCGWNVDGGSSIMSGMNCFGGVVRCLGGMVRCLRGTGESVFRLLSFVVERLADIAVVAEDMSAIAAARRSMA